MHSKTEYEQFWAVSLAKHYLLHDSPGTKTGIDGLFTEHIDFE